MNNIYIGTTTINEKEITFKYENNVLYLFLDILEGNNLVTHDHGNGIRISTNEIKELPFSKIDGYLFESAKKICFYFGSRDYGYQEQISNGGSIFILKINVMRFITYTNNNRVFNSKKSSITFYSNEFQKFLNLIPNLKISPIENGEANGEINFKFESINLESSFVLNGKNYCIKPTYRLNWQGPKFDFTPGLTLEFDGYCNEDELLKLSEILLKFVQYSFMRANIFPSEIAFSLMIGTAGNIYLYHNHSDDELPEKFDYVHRDTLPWNELYKIAGELFCEIYNNDMHLLNLPQKKINRIIVDSISISKDAAAFENIFDCVFPEGIPYGEERKAMEDEVIEELTPLLEKANNKKKRKIYKGFIKHVHLESLCDKVEFALKEYEKCILKVKRKMEVICNVKMSNEEIAEICSGLRNDIDHGNKIDDKVNDKVFPSFIILKVLIYAMQLRKLGMTDDAINESVNDLYLINNLPWVA